MRLELDRFAVFGISGAPRTPWRWQAASGRALRRWPSSAPWDRSPTMSRTGKPALPLLQRRFFLNLSQRTWLLQPGAALGVAAFRRAPDLAARTFKLALGGDDARVLSDRGVRASLMAFTAEALRAGPAGALADFAIYGKPWDIDYTLITAPSALWIGTADPIVPVPVARTSPQNPSMPAHSSTERAPAIFGHGARGRRPDGAALPARFPAREGVSLELACPRRE